MIETIALLRKAADECERRARQPDRAGAIKAEMMDLAAKCHRLAGEAAMLCRMSKKFDGDDDATCAQCLERCFG
jgi:hypothetical protein